MFYWLDGSVINPSYYFSGEPNNNGQHNNGALTEGCLVMACLTAFDFLLADTFCQPMPLIEVRPGSTFYCEYY